MAYDEIGWLIPGNLPELSGLRKGQGEMVKFVRVTAKMFPNGVTSEIRRVYTGGDTC